MPIDEDKKLIFVHIPKCAGTSIEVALNWAVKYPRLGNETTITTPDFATLFGGGLQHLTIREIKDYYLDGQISQYFSFTIIRNPADRLVSHYLWKNYRFTQITESIEHLRRDFEVFVAGIVERYAHTPVFVTPKQGYKYNGVPLEPLLANNAMGRHILPQCSYVHVDGVIAVNRIIAMDKLATGWQKLATVIRDLPPLKKRMKSNSNSPYSQIYTKHVKLRIEELYRQDVELYQRVNTPDSAAAIPHYPCRTTIADHAPVIPRKLFIYWHQGWADAPMIVKQCRQSIVTQNPSWELHLLDARNLSEYVNIPENIMQEDRFPLCALADILRIEILAKYGGIWLDATVWCQVPFDLWIESVCRQGFFAYAKPRADLPLASWFLAASPQNYIIRAWRDRTRQLWQDHAYMEKTRPHWNAWTPKQKEYFWFHRLFQDCLETDGLFKTLWSKVPEISADNPHLLQWRNLLQYPSVEVVDHILNRRSSVYKLTHKIGLPKPLDDTTLGFLLGQGRDRAIHLNPQRMQACVHLQQAKIHSRQNDHSRAIAEVRKAIALDAGNPYSLLQLGNLLVSVNDMENAREALEKAVALAPHLPEPHRRLSHIYFQTEDVEKAIAAIRVAIHLKADNPNFHHHLGNLLEVQSELDAAVTAQKRALELDPHLSDAHNRLSHLYARKNDLKNAIAEIEAAGNLAPDNLSYQQHKDRLMLKWENLRHGGSIPDGDTPPRAKAKNGRTNLEANDQTLLQVRILSCAMSLGRCESGV